jgi:putative serine protease PepD
VGSPFGLDQSVSAGIVSSLARNQMMQSTAGYTLYTNLIQTDAAINPGNSGGALVDAEGKLVGICTLFSSDTESFAGIGFAIPGNYAVDVADKIIAGETVTHAYIGVSMQTVNAQNATANNLSVNQGAYVAEVAEGSPAAAAGLQKGDIITAVNGKSITSADGMILDVRTHQVGETISVTFMRGKEEKTVDVTLGSDERLQEQQKQQSERQNTLGDAPNSYGYGGNGGTGNGYGGNGSGSQDVLEQIYEYLYNNRGGSYDTSDSVTGEAA